VTNDSSFILGLLFYGWFSFRSHDSSLHKVFTLYMIFVDCLLLFFLWVVSTCVLICLVLLMDRFPCFILILHIFPLYFSEPQWWHMLTFTSSNFNMQGHIMSTNVPFFSSSFINVVNFESWFTYSFHLLHFNNGFSYFHLRNLNFTSNNYGTHLKSGPRI